MKTESFTLQAADLAAQAALLEVAERLGLSTLLDSGEPFASEDAIDLAPHLDATAVASLLYALTAVGVLEREPDSVRYMAAPDFLRIRYDTGYLEWALNANRPYIENAISLMSRAPLATPVTRDGHWVAVSSRWVGSRGFYPQTVAELASGSPRKMVDLGAGAGRLMIEMLNMLETSVAVALDLSEAACQEARESADRAGLGDRLSVVNASVQSLLSDASALTDTDAIHAGFVMHDLVKEPLILHEILRVCRDALSVDGKLLIVDAVPYADNPEERAFSALFSFLHHQFMDVDLPPESSWINILKAAGFASVASRQLPMPGSRMFVAIK